MIYFIKSKGVDDMQKRRQKINELINREGQITFSRLKSAFPDLSEMTLRTDLKYLDEIGAIIRIHGGAKSIETVAGTDGFLAQRTIRNHDLKIQIAQKAATLIRGQSSVFLDSGSTTTTLSKYIPDGPRQIFTSGLSCAMELAALKDATVHVIGGTLNKYSQSVAGSRSILEIQSYHFDICFIGVTSFSPEIGFCCEASDDCELKKTAIKQSSYVVALMDSSKFGMVNTNCICPVNGVDAVITDNGLTSEQRQYFEHCSVTVL